MIRFLPLRLLVSAATLAAVLPGHPCHAAPAARRAPEVREDHISVVAIGRGAPVILIPGLASPRAVWDGVASDLAKRHRVFLVQINGFAGDAPGANLARGVLAGVVADLHALIARERIAGAAVVGHSLGGLVALELAKAHPADPGRLMIVDSLPFFWATIAPGLTVAQLEPRAKAMRDAVAGSYGTPNPAAARATADRLALTPAARAKVAGWALVADARVVAEAMYEDLTTDLRPDMAAIRTPITLVYPYSDALPDAQAAPVYHAAYADAPQTRFVPVANAAHFIMLDQPEAFAGALAAFLAG